jgi:autotransporter passenger strand-loop-strand repeat protein
VVLADGSASGTTVSGGTEIVSVGGTDTGALLEAGGSQVVVGLTISTTLDGDDVQTVSAGGTASATVVSATDSQVVLAGGTSVDTVISRGGAEIVSGGGTSLYTVVSSGGTEIVSGGGNAFSGTIEAGGAIEFIGSPVYGGSNTISSGGTLEVGSGFLLGPAELITGSGIANGITVEVLSGGYEGDIVAANGLVLVSSGGTLGGVVSGGGTAIVLSGGSTFILNVSSGGTLELASGASVGANTVQILAGGNLIVSSGFTFTSTTILNGIGSGVSVSVESGGIASNVVNGGTLDVRSGAVVSGAIRFSNTTGLLQIDGVSLPTDPSYLLDGATISSFAVGDTIDLTGILYDSGGTANFAGGTLAITENGDTYDLQLAGGYASNAFVLASDGSVGTDITESTAACYRRGTLIWTERGEVAVEDLTIGDRVMTLSGEAQPVKWIGRRSYAGPFIAGNKDVLPIRIRAGALDVGVPVRDLWVSPEHALYLDEALVPARHLVNGGSIIQVEDVESVEYFHLELDQHAVIIADGALAESFVDDDSRLMFHNALDYYALYPEPPDRAPPVYCAPRLEGGLALEALRRRLAGRAARLCDDGVAAPTRVEGYVDRVQHHLIEGWAVDRAAPERAVTVVILDNGAEIGRAVADLYRADLGDGDFGDGCHGFCYAAPGGLATDIAHKIAVYAESGWVELRLSPVQLAPLPGAARAVPPVSPPTGSMPTGSVLALGLGPLRGCVDKIDRARIIGWAQDETYPERPVGLIVEADGQILGRVMANEYRADIAAAGIGSGRQAFELLLPVALSPLRDHEIRIRREADGAELPGSPVLLPAAAAFDAAVEAPLTGLFARIDSAADEARALEFLAAETDRLLARRASREGDLAAREARRRYRRRRGADPPTGDGPCRALVIDDRVPRPGRDAGSLAILSHMRALRALGFAVSFTASREIADGVARTALAAEGIDLCGPPHYSCVEEVLARQADSFDLVYLHRITNAERYLALARDHQKTARLVYSVADLHHLRLMRQARVEGRPALAVLARMTAASEILAARRADIVITHSPIEAELLRREVGPGKVHVVPFTVPPRGPV